MNHNTPTRRDLDRAIEDTRADTGVLLQKIREEWRDELALRFTAFENRLRLYFIAVLVVLKFNLPDKVTLPTVGAAALYAVAKGTFARFSGN